MKRILLLVALMSFVASSAALAEPFYLGASVGKTGLKVDEFNSTFDGNDTAYKVFAGYRFIKFFGLEGGYVDFGSPSDSRDGIDLEFDATAWDLFAVGVIPVAEHFELFGKAGFFRWDTNVRLSGAMVARESDSGNDAAYGIGLAIKPSKLIAIRLEYERFKVANTDDLNLTSVGVDFRF